MSAGTSQGSSGTAVRPAFPTGELRVQLDDDDVALLDAQSLNSDDEESASRSSPIGNALRSKSKVVATGFLATMVFVGTIGAEVYENVNLHGIKEGTNSVTDLERTLLRDQNTLTQLNLKEESIRSNLLRYVEGSGILSFDDYGSKKFTYAAVSMVQEKTWSKSSDLCKLVGATLAVPSSFEEFQAIALAVRHKSKCFLGPTRNTADMHWTKADGSSIDLTGYWGKNQPSQSPAYSCVTIQSLPSEGTVLYNAQCDGSFPSVKCFVCQRSMQLGATDRHLTRY